MDSVCFFFLKKTLCLGSANCQKSRWKVIKLMWTKNFLFWKRLSTY